MQIFDLDLITCDIEKEEHGGRREREDKGLVLVSQPI